MNLDVPNNLTVTPNNPVKLSNQGSDRPVFESMAFTPSPVKEDDNEILPEKENDSIKADEKEMARRDSMVHNAFSN